MADEGMQEPADLENEESSFVENLVAVATFTLPAEAETSKLLLEQEGIRVFLADDNLVRTNWFLANAVGGAKLQVAASDAERAAKILEDYEASKKQPRAKTGNESVTFACQECGDRITFPADRCGHVENCPSCGAYVDVPDDTESPPSTESKAGASGSIAAGAEPPKALASDSRTTRQLWIEVGAVLCLAYFPYLFTALHTLAFPGPGSAHVSVVYREFLRTVYSLQIFMPLLVILALGKDRWSLFGIVRPAWVTDVVFACVIGVSDKVVYGFVVSMLPISLAERADALHAPHWARPQGAAEYLLLLISFIAGAFSEELVMRGYLIPRFERLLRSTWLPVLITSAVFGSYHLYQGVVPAIGLFASGLVYAVSFCFLRRLWPLCIAHALVNFTLFL
jgi:membrane protease YdiL (CAAX protease family)